MWVESRASGFGEEGGLPEAAQNAPPPRPPPRLSSSPPPLPPSLPYSFPGLPAQLGLRQMGMLHSAVCKAKSAGVQAQTLTYDGAWVYNAK